MTAYDYKKAKPLLELQCLARIYHQRGFDDKAQEILSNVAALRQADRHWNIVDMTDKSQRKKAESAGGCFRRRIIPKN
jgi:hypothetical protein